MTRRLIEKLTWKNIHIYHIHILYICVCVHVSFLKIEQK